MLYVVIRLYSTVNTYIFAIKLNIFFIFKMNMDTYIDNLGFRSLDKVYKAVKEKFPDIKKSDVKEYLESLGAENKNELKPKTMRSKMGKSYSAFIGGYQIDLFIYKRKYYLLAINIIWVFKCF